MQPEAPTPKTFPAIAAQTIHPSPLPDVQACLWRMPVLLRAEARLGMATCGVEGLGRAVFGLTLNCKVLRGSATMPL